MASPSNTNLEGSAAVNYINNDTSFEQNTPDETRLKLQEIINVAALYSYIQILVLFSRVVLRIAVFGQVRHLQSQMTFHPRLVTVSKQLNRYINIRLIPEKDCFPLKCINGVDVYMFQTKTVHRFTMSQQVKGFKSTSYRMNSVKVKVKTIMFGE